METSDEPNGQKALLIHLPPQKEVPFQVVQAEVVLTADRNTSSTAFQRQTWRNSHLFLGTFSLSAKDSGQKLTSAS